MKTENGCNCAVCKSVWEMIEGSKDIPEVVKRYTFNVADQSTCLNTGEPAQKATLHGIDIFGGDNFTHNKEFPYDEVFGVKSGTGAEEEEKPVGVEKEGFDVPVVMYGQEDGGYRVDVPGFCEDDLDVTIEDNIVTIHLKNDERGELIFPIEVPRSTADIKFFIDKGVLSFYMTHNPSSVSISIGTQAAE